MESSGIEQDGRIAFVQSLWHRDIVDQCRDSFLAEAAERGVPADQIDLYEVTGAFEIPLHAKRLAESGRYRAIVASGLVVDRDVEPAPRDPAGERSPWSPRTKTSVTAARTPMATTAMAATSRRLGPRPPPGPAGGGPHAGGVVPPGR